MYGGWYWAEAAQPHVADRPAFPTIGVVLADRVRAAPMGTAFTLVRHIDGHLVLFDMEMMGPAPERSVETISLVRHPSPKLFRSTEYVDAAITAGSVSARTKAPEEKPSKACKPKRTRKKRTGG